MESSFSFHPATNCPTQFTDLLKRYHIKEVAVGSFINSAPDIAVQERGNHGLCAQQHHQHHRHKE